MTLIVEIVLAVSEGSCQVQHTEYTTNMDLLQVLPAIGQVSDQPTEHSTGLARDLLLLLSGDVESNPGPNPPSANSYREGLARLLSGAPKPVREVLVCWDPTLNQTDIMKKFDALLKPALQETMAWLCKVDVKEIKQNHSCERPSHLHRELSSGHLWCLRKQVFGGARRNLHAALRRLQPGLPRALPGGDKSD